MKLTSAPKLVANMKESPLYKVMGVGLTDRIFLLGHAPIKGEDGDPEEPGGLQLNEPYGVADIKEAVATLRNDTDSPLMMAMLEAYFSGARDIYLVASAPMHELPRDEEGVVVPMEDRDYSFYETYRDRLNETYEVLKSWDIAQITIPVDAPFNDYDHEVDFFTPLVRYCVQAFAVSGEIHLAMMGTMGLLDQEMIDLILADARLSNDPSPPDGLSSSELANWEEGKNNWLSAKRFVSVFAGEATFHFKQLPFNHTSPAVVAAAAELSNTPLDRGLTNRRLRQAINVMGPDLSYEQINALAEVGINVVGRTIRGRRGNSFEVVPFTDNTLALEGSDFWSIAQMRLVSTVSSEIRSIGQRAIGTIGYESFRSEVEDYMLRLTSEDVIRSYDLFIYRDSEDKTRVYVDVDMAPYFGIREINVNVEVGPTQV